MEENIATSTLKVTPIQQLAEYSRGSVIELPPFFEGGRFYARLRRPSLLALAKTGRIPNTLIDTANSLFFGGNEKDKRMSKNAMQETLGVVEVLCEASFVEPTYEEIKEAGIELTDDQYMFVFNYAQNGVDALKSFRKQQSDIEDIVSASDIQQASV